MSEVSDSAKYDEALISILVNEKSIFGFLSAIFNFLARRTDFYHVPQGPYENLGFPPGVAEELVVKILRQCDPKHYKLTEQPKASDISKEIMCSTVAQEIEVVTEEIIDDSQNNIEENLTPGLNAVDIADGNTAGEPHSNIPVHLPKQFPPEDYVPPHRPVQKNSEAYNGAVRDKYSWSQTIMELGITMNLPPDIKTAKDLKVTINASDICIQHRSSGEILIKDSFPHKIKAMESFWTISEGRLMIHLEKQQERWWKSLLNQEEEIDLSKIDCSRPLDDLPEEHIAKVHELQWNQEQKMRGLPTSDEIRNMEILKKAWNLDGSPFKGTEFNPNLLKH